MSSRVRVARGETLAREVESMLGGSGTVLRLADPNHAAEPVDERRIPDDFTGVLVNTSGSTGTPKTVMLSRVALLAAAKAATDRLGGPGSWANPLPGWYVAGLMTRVRAIVAGMAYTEVSAHLEDLRPAQGRAYISLVPAQLHLALSDAEILRNLASYSAILIGGARLDGALRSRAGHARLPIVTTYGMSETCGGVVYDGIPLDGVSIRIQDAEELSPDVWCRQIHAGDGENRDYDDTRAEETTTLPANVGQDQGGRGGQRGRFFLAPKEPERTVPVGPPAGRIRITTATIFDGYVGDPELTAWVRDGNSFLTNDRGRFVDGRLQVLGRVDDVVQSGGTNVDLSEIQHLLDAAFPHQTACFAYPDPVWGSTVIVASTGPGLDEIWDKLHHHLDSAAKPRGILHIDALPRTSSGKIDREILTKMWRNNGERP